jgi:threonyl-tRNA synthetase
MRVELPDGTPLELADGASGLEAAAAIGPRLAQAAVAVGVGDEVRDVRLPLSDGEHVRILTDRDPEALAVLRHSTAHVMAEAVLHLWPDTKVAIGPAIADGFYYDFEFSQPISSDDLERIEQEMRRILSSEHPFQRQDGVDKAEILARFEQEQQPYKLELARDLPDGEISLYTQDGFEDLCRGPHLQTTKPIKAFRLLSTAGAYWRGNSDNTMLTRIYGTAFFTQKDLDAHLERIEEAKRRDHRRLGRDLDLFHFSDNSPGSPYWHPRGMVIWTELTKLWRELNGERGYLEVRTPILYNVDVWKRSGHWEVYRENMYFTEVEAGEFGLKPMNCPGHIDIYADQRRSYRDLPLRLTEQGLVHRHEPSGTLHGLLRVRSITQDDAHIFATEDQIEEEVIRALEFGFAIYERFGFEPRLELSTRPEKRIGTEEMWDKAEAALQNALDKRGLEYEVNEGDGAFYGPKIDLHMTDAIGRSWQLGTVQLDYVMPERFELTYTGADNAEHRPVMIHRALMGSFERFIGMLIEHYAGEFPVWLAPVQAIVLPVSDRHLDYAREVKGELSDFRVEVDERTESIGRKIRDAELRKIPYMLVVGDREVENKQVAVRRHREGDQGALSLEAVREKLAAPE